MSYQTLLSELKRIKSSEFVHFDRNAEYRDTIANWRSKNSLVERVAVKEIYLPDEFDSLVKRVGGSRLYYPNSLSEEDSKELEEFNDVVGGVKGADLIGNPITLGVGFGVFGGAASTGLDWFFGDDVTRRDFLKRAAIYSGVFMGGLSACSVDEKDKMGRKRDDVAYVQDRIERYSRF